MLAFNLLEILRGEMESAADPRENPPHTPGCSGWDMDRFRSVMLKVGGTLSRASRRLLLDIAEGIAPLSPPKISESPPAVSWIVSWPSPRL
jgi:hypothetical protein